MRTWLNIAGALCAMASAIVLLLPLRVKSMNEDSALVSALVRAQVPTPFPWATNPTFDAEGQFLAPGALQESAELEWANRFARQRRRDRWAAVLALAAAALALLSTVL